MSTPFETSDGQSLDEAVKTRLLNNADTNVLSDAEKSKLAGIESGATADQTGAEIKGLYEAETNTNAFTDAEKSKLASLNDSHYLGLYTNETALTTAHPTANPGDYAYVDSGAASDVQIYAWDNDDTQWVVVGSGGSETAASVKSKYESNADTNAFTNTEKAKLGVSALLIFDAGGTHTTARPTSINGYILTAADRLFWHNHGDLPPENMIAGDAAEGVSGTMKAVGVSADFTLTAAQLGTTFVNTETTKVTITIPLAVAALGGFVNFMQGNTGVAEIAVVAGATINGRDGSTIVTAGEGETLFLFQPDVVNTWFGNRQSA